MGEDDNRSKATPQTAVREEEPDEAPAGSASECERRSEVAGDTQEDGPSQGTHQAEAEGLKRLHILPLAGTNENLNGKGRFACLAPELKKIRSERSAIQAGQLIRNEDSDFVVIKCDPAEGVLGKETDYFMDGNPVVGFEKIQFSAWGPNTLTQDELFTECIKPYFKGEFAPYGAANCKRVRLFYTNQVIQVGEVSLQVEATQPAGLGIVTTDTEIFATWDSTSEFQKVHILPFQDTLPRAYQFDIFTDYLKPFLASHTHKKFQINELFTYQGVQFKLVACEPETVARIGKSTTIFCEGLLNPSLRNLLPPNLLNQVAQLPPGLQMLLLNTERSTRELEDMLSHRRGLFPSTLSEIESFNWPPADSSVTQQQTCMVCLCEFQIADTCRRLPCNHVFHQGCIDEWLQRCTDCPICKSNVDRAIRNY
eukprot:TRINITY_DN42711_c0_g1_i1.p1 TRINITY_DN42711_c0_g1~~TRINITY_DN42711_c0_g1_i1.p1  ORF type:complete len:425 (-),score=64.26 TRINITY_DN42711_c0_g1_i1:278-1552(-)